MQSLDHGRRSDPPRVLLVLNENPVGSHPGIHNALAELLSEGAVSSWSVFPYLHVRSTRGDHAAVEELYEECAALEPDVVIWAHTMDWRIDDAAFERLPRSRAAVDVYWEADSYHPLFKPLLRPMVQLARRTSLVFIPCGGWMYRELRLRGCRDVRYAPSATSLERFPLNYDACADHENVVALIGNRVRSRIPGKTMPGAVWRADVVRALEREFGLEFAVYGDGWTGPCARGPVAFDEQRTVYSQARVALGVNNSNYPFVFSNRLPIAMSCGIPIAYGRNPGFDTLFPFWMQSQFFGSTTEAVKVVRALVDRSNESLSEVSVLQRREVESKFTHTSVLRYMIGSALALRAGAEQPVNPWLGPQGLRVGASHV